jgi:hypothetical protein
VEKPEPHWTNEQMLKDAGTKTRILSFKLSFFVLNQLNLYIYNCHAMSTCNFACTKAGNNTGCIKFGVG